MRWNIVGYVAATAVLSACNFSPVTPDERIVYESMSDAVAGRLVSFSDRLSPGLRVTGFRGRLGQRPPHEDLMYALRDVQYTIGITTTIAVIPVNSGVLAPEAARAALGPGPGETVLSGRFSSVKIRALHRYPQSMMLGPSRDLGVFTIVRGRIQDANGNVRAEERISGVSITDPCLLPEERREHG